MTSSHTQLRLRPIHDLLGEDFFVPSYQRGYRWTSRQVVALLDDLETFRQTAPNDNNAYYCLQPIVVRRRDDDAWELIDGQQRLTTIYLILRHLSEFAELLGRGRYGITYETRPDSATFLDDPGQGEKANQNIDFRHIFDAYQDISDWFEGRDGGANLDFLKCLTAPDGSEPNVRVIWYELEEAQDPAEAFIRLNVGKIPLTSAELIRALLLRMDESAAELSESPRAARDRTQIAQDWDAIEKRLRDDEFWHFLHSGANAPPARIKFLLDIFVRTLPSDVVRDHNGADPLWTFLAFQDYLDSEKRSHQDAWRPFKWLAQTLEEWFEDRTLYHLIGFLIASETSEAHAGAELLVKLYKAQKDRTGSEFEQYLRGLIWQKCQSRGRGKVTTSISREELDDWIDDQLETLEYHSSRQVRRVLLLFNIAGMLQSDESTQRFQFEHYNKGVWDIEHVRSVAEYIPEAPAKRTQWLRHAGDFINSPAANNLPDFGDLPTEIEELLAEASPDPKRFSDVFRRVRKLTGEPEARENDDTLANLVLLDRSTNRSYKNAIFPVKRKQIIALDKKGQFVPPGTRNVFLKYYHPDAAQLMLWGDEDQQAYREAISETLEGFFADIVDIGNS